MALHILKSTNFLIVFASMGLFQTPLDASLLPAVEAPPPSHYIVPLHRQRVAVKSDAETVSYKSVYFGTISIGAPIRQEFSVVFDTGSGHVIVPSTECENMTCQMHRRYNRELSPDAVDVDYDGTPVEAGASRDQITVAFGTGEVTGHFVNDRLCLGSEDNLKMSSGSSSSDRVKAKGDQGCIDIRAVMATEMTHEPFHAFAFDGVLGLGLDALALAPEFNFFSVMIKQRKLLQPHFGVFLAENDDEQSEISFGGYSTERLLSPLSYAPVAYPELGYWQVHITSLRIGNSTHDYCSDGQCRAVVDTGTSLLAVPKDFADELEEALRESMQDPVVTPDVSHEGMNCKMAKGSPLHFDIAGATLTLDPSDYARPVVQLQDEQLGGVSQVETPEQHVCRPTLMPIELQEPLGPKLFIWGEPFLKKYYTLYDWENKRIGFGLAAHIAEEETATVTPRPLLRKPLLF